mgnify:CR=1 FL=1
MKNFKAIYKGKELIIKANNIQNALAECRKTFTCAHWSEITIYKVR